MIEIRSEPSGATVDIAGFGTRTTPTFVMLSRSQSYIVHITKDGYKPVTTNLVAQIAASRATPDAGVMSVIGSAFDVASGGSWELCPDKLAVTLEAASPVQTAAAAAVSGPSQPKGAPATPPIVQTAPPIVASTPPASLPVPPTPSTLPAVPSPSPVLVDQLARLDRLLEQGVITKREHEILTAAALSSAAIAGATTAQ
jgi:hypothetical protein